jgi:site-specific DNA-methyltransferase (adenine-specific)
MTTSTIIQGDCRDVLPDLDIKIDCLLTDPPYGVDFQSTYGKSPEAREKYQAKIEDDEDPAVALETFAETMNLIIPKLADTAELYIFSQWQVAPEWQVYLRSLAEQDIHLRQLLIWEKGYPGIGDVKYNWGCGHEFIFYLKKGRRPVPYRRVGVLHIDKVRPGTNIHPTQKPTELLKILIEYSTDPGQVVFDPFVGSGSTVVAAQETGRIGIGVEKKPQYAKDAQSRIAQGGLLSL